MRFKGKIALIAGGGRSAGKLIALSFARVGADLVLVARTGSEVEQVAKECEALGVQALPVTADLAKSEDARRAVKLGLERFGKVDTLVCVAGMRPHYPFWDVSDEQWLQVFGVNC